ncbi:MAG: hypothetical protein AB7K68_08340 [Bacteriovoracia bacterium]
MKKTLCLFLFLALFVSHSLVHVGSLLRGKQPALNFSSPVLPVLFSFAQQPLVFDRESVFFNTMEITLSAGTEALVLSGAGMRKFVENYYRALLFFHWPHHVGKLTGKSVLTQTFCRNEERLKSELGFPQKPEAVDWVVRSSSRTILFSEHVECGP